MFGKKKQQKYIDWFMVGEADPKLLGTTALKSGRGKGPYFYYIENWMNSSLGYNGSYQFINLKECTSEEINDLPAERATHIITPKSPYATFRKYGQEVKLYCIVGGWIGKQWYNCPEPFEAPLLEGIDFQTARWMKVDLIYACPTCGIESKKVWEVGIVLDADGVFLIPIKQVPSCGIRLPTVLLSDDGQGNLAVEDIHDYLKGKIIPLSKGRWKEVEAMSLGCPHCSGEQRCVWGVGLVHNERGEIVLVPNKTQPEVHNLPIVLLSSDQQGNFTVVGIYPA